MSEDPQVGDAKARSQRREAERQRQREERKAQRTTSASTDNGVDDPNDPLAAERRKYRERNAAKAAAQGGGYDGGEMTQEDHMIQHAQKLQSENSASLKNTIKVARETTVVGASTIHKLDEQTEQLNRMDGAMDETNDSLTRSERILRGMKSLGGAFANMFGSDKSKKKEARGSTGNAGTAAVEDLAEKDRMREKRRESEADQARRNDRASSSSYGPSSSPSRGEGETSFGTNVVSPNAKQSAAIASFKANQAQEDDALDELSDVLGTLKQQSETMNTQLAQHSQILDGLGDKVDATSDRLKKGSRTIGKIIRDN